MPNYNKRFIEGEGWEVTERTDPMTQSKGELAMEKTGAEDAAERYRGQLKAAQEEVAALKSTNDELAADITSLKEVLDGYRAENDKLINYLMEHHPESVEGDGELLDGSAVDKAIKLLEGLSKGKKKK